MSRLSYLKWIGCVIIVQFITLGKGQIVFTTPTTTAIPGSGYTASRPADLSPLWIALGLLGAIVLVVGIIILVVLIVTWLNMKNSGEQNINLRRVWGSFRGSARRSFRRGANSLRNSFRRGRGRRGDQPLGKPAHKSALTNPAYTGEKERQPPPPGVCKLYQTNDCQYDGDHTGYKGGLKTVVKHICMKCFTLDKSEHRHREMTPECRYFKGGIEFQQKERPEPPVFRPSRQPLEEIPMEQNIQPPETARPPPMYASLAHDHNPKRDYQQLKPPHHSGQPQPAVHSPHYDQYGVESQSVSYNRGSESEQPVHPNRYNRDSEWDQQYRRNRGSELEHPRYINEDTSYNNQNARSYETVKPRYSDDYPPRGYDEPDRRYNPSSNQQPNYRPEKNRDYRQPHSPPHQYPKDSNTYNSNSQGQYNQAYETDEMHAYDRSPGNNPNSQGNRIPSYNQDNRYSAYDEASRSPGYNEARSPYNPTYGQNQSTGSNNYQFNFNEQEGVSESFI